jgi:hypothetical protein
MKTSITERSLKQLRQDIAGHASLTRPYDHNIIGLLLRQIATRFGDAAANEAIIDLGLQDKGWSVKRT